MSRDYMGKAEFDDEARTALSDAPKTPSVVYATVRDGTSTDGESEWHIECRFNDGQKFAAIVVDGQFEWLADLISAFLTNNLISIERERVQVWIDTIRTSPYDGALAVATELKTLLPPLPTGSKRIGSPCPGCGRPLIRVESMFHWRGDYRSGAVCKPCNSVWPVAGEEIEPLRTER